MKSSVYKRDKRVNNELFLCQRTHTCKSYRSRESRDEHSDNGASFSLMEDIKSKTPKTLSRTPCENSAHT